MTSIGLVDYIKLYFNFWAIIFKGKSNFLVDLIIQIPGTSFEVISVLFGLIRFGAMIHTTFGRLEKYQRVD